MPQRDPPFIFRLTPLVLQLMGLDAQRGRALLARCHLPERASLGVCTAPLSAVRALLDEATSAHNGPLPFSVLLAQRAPEGTYGMAELLVRTAPTLETGLKSLAQYAALINPIARFELSRERELVRLDYFVVGCPDTLGEVLNEFTIAFIAQAIARVSSDDFALESVWFSHRTSRSFSALGEHFRCPVSLAKRTCGFAFSAERAERPLRTADPVVFAFLQQQANERLAALGERSFSVVLVDLIETQIGFARLDLNAVADALSMTPRTVQRRLDEENVTFREVVDGARRRQFERMSAAGASIDSISESLGFSDVKSFRRALRRWLDHASE